MRSKRLIRVLGTLLIGMSSAAMAQNAFTARPLNVRAGPDRDYPLVAQLGPNTPVEVNGCLNDWSWCDVSFDGNRGWAYAPGLNYLYQGERVPLYSYAPGLGIPVITFSLGTYWDQYYRGRPWFGQRAMWMHRRIPHRRPPGPPPQARLPLHAQQFGRPRADESHLGGRGPEAAPRHGEPGRRYAERGAERGGSKAPEAAPRPQSERPQTAQRAPAESRERAPAERGAPPAERSNRTEIRSADRRSAHPANEKSGSRPNEREAPGKDKRDESTPRG
jgi:uncharacterized protein YraI